MQYPLSPVTDKRSSDTLIWGALSCNAIKHVFGDSARYNHPGIGFPAQSALSSNSCRNGAWGSGSAKIYLYPSLLNGCSNGYPCAGNFTLDWISLPSLPFFPVGPESVPGNFLLAWRPTLEIFGTEAAK